MGHKIAQYFLKVICHLSFHIKYGKFQPKMEVISFPPSFHLKLWVFKSQLKTVLEYKLGFKDRI